MGLTAVNPWIGAAAGVLKGLLSAAEAKKQRKRDAESTKFQNEAKIESVRNSNQAQLLASLGNSLSATLRR